jgi:uncharacterized protein (TIGR02246 family)
MDRSVADELAIRNLVARYCHAIADRDDKAWAECWCADAEWNVLGQSVRGREAILAHYQKLISGCRWVEQVATDAVIELDGDPARGKWRIAETIFPNEGAAMVNRGWYSDQYRRDPDGRWRFARREFRGNYFGAADLSGKPR